MPPPVAPTDLRRLYIKNCPTRQDAGTAALEEVAALFPDLVVRSVHYLERRRGGWYVEVATRMRTQSEWKKTMPTHTDTKTRAVPHLDGYDSLAELLDEIRRLSEEVLGDSEAALILVGEPGTMEEAETMLDALQLVGSSERPESAKVGAVLLTLRDYLGEPVSDRQLAASAEAESDGSLGDSDDIFDPNASIDASVGESTVAPQESGPQPATSRAAAPSKGDSMLTKTCSRCDKEKPTSEFSKNAKSKDGLERRCRPCTKKYRAELRIEKKQDADPPKDGHPRVTPSTPDVLPTAPAPASEWREAFVNPTLDQLEHLRSFIGGITFDDAVLITREIAGVEVGSGR